MATATATALHETNGKVFVICPHCETVHEHDAATTPRLIAVDAVCDPKLNYTIGVTMKSKKFIAAINLYQYELDRKRARYHRRKNTVADPASE